MIKFTIFRYFNEHEVIFLSISDISFTWFATNL